MCEVVTCAIPGVVTNSMSRPSSLKNPLSRATNTGRSWTAFMIATLGFANASCIGIDGSSPKPDAANDLSLVGRLSTAQPACYAVTCNRTGVNHDEKHDGRSCQEASRCITRCRVASGADMGTGHQKAWLRTGMPASIEEAAS